MSIRALATARDVADATGSDAMACWAAQRFGSGGSAVGYGTAVAVVAPGLFRRDRLVVRGPVDDVTELIDRLLPELPDTYRVLGSSETVQKAAESLPWLTCSHTFGWMETTAPPPSDRILPAASGRAAWLPDAEHAEAAELVRRAHPGAWAVPGTDPAHRWAGIRSEGRLVALAADAWSSTGVGFVAGVLSDPTVRRAGHAAAVTSFVTRHLLATYGVAALMVDGENHAAIGLYRTIGYRWEEVAAGAFTGPA